MKQGSGPLLVILHNDTDKLLKGNYERLFDQARQRVRAWEQVHVK